ncbi:MAG: response regulator [Deltaproteobacteria bacterium]|nr:response regulator [Deltaproteobacteria bacterium]
MEEKATILIVDDRVSVHQTMSFILGAKGYGVTTAQDGPEAIGKVKETPFNIVFMDIKMPLMNGVETYRRMKEIRPETAVVMMTAYAVEDLVAEALAEGAYGVIYKPLDMEKVFAIIEQARAAQRGAFILLVDDDPGICATLKYVLLEKGYNVAIAHTGEEAVAMVKKRAHDIAFIDMKLPTINGLETYLAIRAIRPEVVAVMITAYRQEMADLVQEALNNDAYACLYKPFKMEDVIRLVDEILKTKHFTSLASPNIR